MIYKSKEARQEAIGRIEKKLFEEKNFIEYMPEGKDRNFHLKEYDTYDRAYKLLTGRYYREKFK